jgi:hypothetical protein
MKENMMRNLVYFLKTSDAETLKKSKWIENNETPTN